MFSIIFCIFLVFTAVTDTARILVVIPTPSISHQVVLRPVTLELAKRGHEVVVITTDPMFTKNDAPVNYMEIDVHDISYDTWKEFVVTSSKNFDIIEQVKIAFKQIEIIFEKQLQKDEIQNILNKNQKFDILFIESWVTVALAFTHILKVPTIQFSSLGPHPGICEIAGIPSHPFLYPIPPQKRVRNLSIWEKIQEYYYFYYINEEFSASMESGSKLLKNMFGADFPTIRELRNNVDMIFLNVHPAWDFNRPVSPNVIYLGGLHQSKPKTLPQELKSYLDSSTNGVIYMSLGTNVKPSILPQQTIQLFLKVFSSLPYNVLWKWDRDELEGRSSNVNISKWFPQSDLLHHPNVKLFITQGGLQSTDESITAGVPLVGIPILGDQWYNTDLYVHHKIGVKLDIETLKEEDFLNAINTVLKDDSYRNNIVKLKKLMQDQPQTPLERAIWWTEYVLRHGGARHLRSPAVNITWTDYLELELVALIITFVLVLLILLVLAIKIIIQYVFPHAKIKTN